MLSPREEGEDDERLGWAERSRIDRSSNFFKRMMAAAAPRTRNSSFALTGAGGDEGKGSRWGTSSALRWPLCSSRRSSSNSNSGAEDEEAKVEETKRRKTRRGHLVGLDENLTQLATSDPWDLSASAACLPAGIARVASAVRVRVCLVWRSGLEIWSGDLVYLALWQSIESTIPIGYEWPTLFAV
eukprot:scaffold4592_cov169-Ochromonas_danica.AAC.7